MKIYNSRSISCIINIMEINMSLIKIASSIAFLFYKHIAPLCLLYTCPGSYCFILFHATIGNIATLFVLILPMLSEFGYHLFHLSKVILPEHIFLPNFLFSDAFVGTITIQQILNHLLLISYIACIIILS